MADYDFSGLSSRSFEHLIQALAVKVLGPGVTIHGDGPDGGRDAVFNGQASYPSSADRWHGYGVIQAKFRQRPRDSTQDGKWAVDQLKSELKKYLQPENSLRKPEYFIFATNVALTPVPERGSKDRVRAVFDEFESQLSLKDYAVWDYDQIRAFLDDSKDIRDAYTAFITPGDVLAEIVGRLNPQPLNFEETLTNFLQKELLSDEFVNLEQAGHDTKERIPLAQVFVDLHTSEHFGGRVQDWKEGTYDHDHADLFEGDDQGFIKEILEISAERLNRQSPAIHTMGQSPETGDPQQSRGRFVLIGGPGQGKTTVGQFICQILRASIISRKPQDQLSPEICKALSLIQTHCQDEGIACFPVPRFPFRIVLNEFASALSASSAPDINSVFSYLAHQIRKRTDREVAADDIRQWLTQYPSVIVFDGLDEVPSSSNREQVLASIRDFWVDVSPDADVLAIATSRPQGYNEDFSPAYYRHHWLVPLSKPRGRHFAQRLVDVRYGTDADRKEKVLGRLERSFESASTSRLMHTPLQVTIMTALVDRMGQPPQMRWNLFKAYYNVIYQREVERDIPASDILRNYDPDINAIHNRVGLLLQIDSEQSGRTDARLSSQRFWKLVEERLKGEGYTGKDLQQLTGQIFNAALERLVFLVGLEADQVGFEIRSLQEFMAAECLMEGSDEAIRRRLQEIAPIPGWRNVFLFASGKCFADIQRQHLRDTVHVICTTLNETDNNDIAGICLAGSGLAIELLDDGLSRHQPKFVQSFARIALRSLDVPNPRFHAQLSRVYEPQLEQVYRDEIAKRLNDSRDYCRIGAWKCLISLTDAQIQWAQELAETHWPSNPEDQLKLLDPEEIGYISRPWTTSKFLELALQIPVSSLPEFLELDRIETQDLLPVQKIVLNILVKLCYSGDSILRILGHLTTLPLLRESDRKTPWLLQLHHLENYHPSWTIFISVARFWEKPSQERLADVLKVFAPLLGNGIDAILKQNRLMPWPILACLGMCTDETQVLALADRAASGELGDVSDWIAAENRWTKKGITVEDIRSMSDDRLPFDARIATSGFPITLSTGLLVVSPDNTTLFRSLLTLHAELPKCQSRTFVAHTITKSLYWRSDFMSSAKTLELIPDTLNIRSLQSIYEDLPPAHTDPLSLIIGLFTDSSQAITDFIAAMAERGIKFNMYHSAYNSDNPFHQLLADKLSKAFQEVSNNTVLLPILGQLATYGKVAGPVGNVPSPEQLESVEYKVAALIVLMAQESWETDNTEWFLERIQDIGQLCNGIYDRVITAMQNNRPQGPYVNQFLVQLGRVLPQGDYEIRTRHMSLLDDSLRRRTSRFSDPNEFRQLNLPQGIVPLLSAQHQLDA